MEAARRAALRGVEAAPHEGQGRAQCLGGPRHLPHSCPAAQDGGACGGARSHQCLQARALLSFFFIPEEEEEENVEEKGARGLASPHSILGTTSGLSCSVGSGSSCPPFAWRCRLTVGAYVVPAKFVAFQADRERMMLTLFVVLCFRHVRGDRGCFVLVAAGHTTDIVNDVGDVGLTQLFPCSNPRVDDQLEFRLLSVVPRRARP